MTTHLKLLLSQDAFQGLHETTNSKKAVVRVSRQTLTNLLIDYSVMLAALEKDTGITIKEPVNGRVRPRLNHHTD